MRFFFSLSEKVSNYELRLSVCGQSELGLKQMEVEGETVEVFGIERIVHSVEDSPTTWQCYFLPDG